MAFSKFFVLLALASFALSAQGHIEIEPSTAANGTTLDAGFRIGHGCSGNDTVALNITIPGAFASVRPRFNPNANITWGKASSGDYNVIVSFAVPVPSTMYDVVEISFKTPAAPNVYYFPTWQTCGNGSYTNWALLPGQNSTDPHGSPAPSLNVTAPVAASAASTAASTAGTKSAGGRQAVVGVTTVLGGLLSALFVAL